MSERESKDKNPTIVPEKRRGFSVAPSPFNPVKLEWAVAVIIGVLLILVADRVVSTGAWQFAGILAYVGVASGWLVWRIRRIHAQHQVRHGQE